MRVKAMNVIKLSGTALAPEIFGDKVLKRNTWNGTGYEKATYTVLRRPVPPWARERYGPSILRNVDWQRKHGVNWTKIAEINDLFAAAAQKANVEALKARGLAGKKFLKYRAKFIGKYVKNGGNVSIDEILPASTVRNIPTAISHIEF